MKTVLIADDDQDVLRPICAYLTHKNAEIVTIPATSGEECVEILKTQKVDLVLSDLRMPEGDGIDVLAYLSRNNPSLPVVVMSGYAMSQAAEDLVKFGNLRFLSKPAGMDQVYQVVSEALRETVEIGSLHGFSLAGILQLIEMEEKTCLLEVEEGSERQGYFALVSGRMVRAASDEIAGEDAALEMLTWDQPRVQVRGLPHSEMVEPDVHCNVTELLMRSFKGADERKLDEANRAAREAVLPPTETLSLRAPTGAESTGSHSADLAGSAIFARASSPSVDAQDEKKARRHRPRGQSAATAAVCELETPPPIPQTRPEEQLVVARPAAPEPNILPSTSLAHEREVKIEHPSPGPGIAIFLGVAGLLIGFQWMAPRFADYIDIYLWTRSLLGLAAVSMVLADAYQNGAAQLAGCIVFPPYAVLYALTRLTSYPQRALFMAVVVALVTEAFFLPEHALVLVFAQWMKDFADSVDRLIVRAGA